MRTYFFSAISQQDVQKNSECDIVMIIKQSTSSNSKRKEIPEELTRGRDDASYSWKLHWSSGNLTNYSVTKQFFEMQ